MTPDEIRQARSTLGLSQAQLAKALGYKDKSRISELERGVERPGESVVRLLQAYLAGYRPTDWPAGS